MGDFGGNKRRTKRKGKRREREEGVKVIFLNILLAGIKSMSEEDWEYLEGFEIIGLTETWGRREELESWTKKKQKGYLIEWRDARRERQRGGERGGCVMAVKEKKKRLKVEWEKERTDEVIIAKVKIEGKKGMVLHRYT